jgi:hypothetical protein
MPRVLATSEMEIGGSQTDAYPRKNTIPYLKNKLKAKGLGHGSTSRMFA